MRVHCKKCGAFIGKKHQCIVSWNKGKKMSKEFKEKARKRQLGKCYTKGQKRPKMTKEKHPMWKGGWKNKIKCMYCGKQLENFYAKRCTECFWKYDGKLLYQKENMVEKKVDSYLNKNFPNQWKFVGDGQVWIARKNPDFLNINGEKKIIEVFGNYWHRNDDGQDRIKHFKKYGFETLILWESEINSNIYKEKLNIFMKEKN